MTWALDVKSYGFIVSLCTDVQTINRLSIIEKFISFYTKYSFLRQLRDWAWVLYYFTDWQNGLLLKVDEKKT